MRRLFWRIFALFWAQRRADRRDRLDHLEQFREREDSGPGITRLESLNEHLRNAAHASRQRVGGLRTMLRKLDFGRISVYVLDADKKDLLDAKYRPR